VLLQVQKRLRLALTKEQTDLKKLRKHLHVTPKLPNWQACWTMLGEKAVPVF
jgi:hypothetical protein